MQIKQYNPVRVLGAFVEQLRINIRQHTIPVKSERRIGIDHSHL